MSQFDQFANQGGVPQSADEVTEARRRAEEHLNNADVAVHLSEPLGHDAAAEPDDSAVEPDGTTPEPGNEG